MHADLQQDPLIAHGLEALWGELGRADPPARLFSDSILSAIVVRLARLAAARGPAPFPRGGLAPHHSARVIDYLQAHLDERVTLGDLAALTGLSPWHFARAFRQSHGEPPHRHLTRLRVERARERLEHGDDPVGEIALAVGYTPQQLVRHLREATGLTPREYRRQSRR
nr:AraC family transcriptional regulator [Thioalkalivibrio sp. ALJ24]